MESLVLQKGSYGPIRKFPPEGLRLSPFTLFLGETGTGKSWLSMLICYLRNLPHAIRLHGGSGDKTKEQRLTEIIDGLRREMSVFSEFVSSSVSFEYTSPLFPGRVEFELDNRKGAVFSEKIKPAIEQLANTQEDVRQALYIPAERAMLVFDNKRGVVWEGIDIPRPSVVLRHWHDAVFEIGNFLERQVEISRNRDAQWVRQKGIEVLSGEVLRKGGRWVWNTVNLNVDILVISGGQRAGWPMVVTSMLLFFWREKGKIPQNFALHIEEPEIGLSPVSQRGMSEILAYLVNRGFRVLATTHSLAIVYAVNNLLLASKLPASMVNGEIPGPEIRLERGSVASYWFGQDGTITDLVDRDTGLFSEKEITCVYNEAVEQSDLICNLLGSVK